MYREVKSPCKQEKCYVKNNNIILYSYILIQAQSYVYICIYTIDNIVFENVFIFSCKTKL